MIKFFRTIRQKLLIESKFNKYLLYAIGEIILVVLGILIALQINTWNDGRKLKSLEKTTLYELENSIVADIENLEGLINLYGNYFKDIEILRDHIAAKKDYESFLDSLWVSPVFGYHFRPNISAFQALENRGIELISNKALRDEISEHYNVSQEKIVNSFLFMEDLQKQFIHYYFDLVYPHIDDEYVKNYTLDFEIQLPKSYEDILDDELIIGELNHRMNANLMMIYQMKEFIKTKRKLKESIITELEDMNKECIFRKL